MQEALLFGLPRPAEAGRHRRGAVTWMQRLLSRLQMWERVTPAPEPAPPKAGHKSLRASASQSRIPKATPLKSLCQPSGCSPPAGRRRGLCPAKSHAPQVGARQALNLELSPRRQPHPAQLQMQRAAQRAGQHDQLAPAKCMRSAGAGIKRLLRHTRGSVCLPSSTHQPRITSQEHPAHTRTSHRLA